MTSEPKSTGLCFRCEYRARYLETGHGPRSECQSKETAVHGCYMYRPTCPVVLAPLKGDKRPLLAGWAFAGRAYGVRVFNGVASIVKVKGGITILYRKTEKRKKN